MTYLEAYAIPPTPLEVASDFLWIIRFSEYYSQRFQREVRQLNSLSEFLQRFEEIQVYQLRCRRSWSAFEAVLEGFGALLGQKGKTVCVFCMVLKTSILTSLTLSFSLVFFLSVTGAVGTTRPDLPR